MYEMYGIVIDEQGYMVTSVVLDEDGIPQDHILKDNEQIIGKDAQIAWSMKKAKWNFDTEEWEETEPIEPPQIDICEPTDRERMDQLEGVVGMLAEQVARQSLGM